MSSPIKGRRKEDKRRSSSVPMSNNQRIYNTDGLISPPPEDALELARNSAKRKRTTPQPQQLTPNPKPRKQSKRPQVYPLADYLPPKTTRRTTPIPAYEPPTDIFTPPRIVILNKPAATTTTRKSTKKRASTAELTIKIEPPQIDLSTPMPPPSPTDDPLLLSAASSSPLRRRLCDAAVNTSPISMSLPPSSPPSDMDLDNIPLFDVTNPNIDIDLDSDSDNELPADQGEFTGRFHSFSVRTKMDPPSSATRERQEEWGRPITPFPFRKKIGKLELLREEEDVPQPFDFETSFEEPLHDINVDHPEPPAEILSHEDDAMDTTNDAIEEFSQHFNFETSFEEPLHDHVDDDDEVKEEDAPAALAVPVDLPREPTPLGAFDFDVSFDEPTENQPLAVVQQQEPVPHVHEEPEETVENHDHAQETQTLEQSSDEQNQSHSPGLVQADMNEEEEEADEREVRQMSLPPEDEDEETDEREVRQMSLPPEDEDEETDEREVRQMSLPPEDEDEETNECEVREMSLALEDEEEETDEREVREMSLALEDEEVDEQSFALPVDTPAPAQANFGLEDDADEEDGDDEEEEMEYGLVKITSADPRAAARAAAILKQHDYDCFTKLTYRLAHKDEDRHRRHSLSENGITKRIHSPRDKPRRRSSGASIIGDQVYFPDSPVTTLPELLREAEATVTRGASASSTPFRFTTHTPALASPSVFTPKPNSAHSFSVARKLFETGNIGSEREEKPWTKEEWKLLDACFTDERLALGSSSSYASVDFVRPEDVAKRFVDLYGGDDLEAWGEAWSMENLIRRVNALQNKQRKGILAPPTTSSPYMHTPPPPPSLSTMHSAFTRRMSSMEVPDFTPLGKRAGPPAGRRRPTLPPPARNQDSEAPFQNLNDTPEIDKEEDKKRSKKKQLPLSLLAPRYSHLLEEAVAVSQLPDPDPVDTNGANESNGSIEGASDESSFDHEEVDANTSIETTATSESDPSSPHSSSATADPSNTLQTRVKGFIFSYLPTLSSKTPASKPKSSRPGLPLPSPSVLENSKSRGPIITPARAPLPKPTHPKELVNLQPAPAPAVKTSMIPRPRPKRMVELHRVSPPKEKEKVVTTVRPRRSSGASSVRDLVKGFEDMEKNKSVDANSKGELRRMKSVGEWRKTAGNVNAKGGDSRPSWRP